MAANGMALTSDGCGTVIVTGAPYPVTSTVAVRPAPPWRPTPDAVTVARTRRPEVSAQTSPVMVWAACFFEIVATILLPVAWTPSTVALPSDVTVAWWARAKARIEFTLPRADATLVKAPGRAEAALDGRPMEIHGSPRVDAEAGDLHVDRAAGQHRVDGLGGG